ncbi:XdhC family protein [Desulfoprunum benzoelyticum]|uniref:Xanthine dehydrogenase accessory factor n=1 Tax=Desulfoprunum benzoelyticum TaxID=1506996 RepID=A0A840V6M5_9BACT|nr:XdhC/CoxI family protein [Desulfoprunum benzoelyticum]MBB5348681.1 xanthine dehydrogenase accessory factor [Desulfoprunum benzoelyticum]MBM9530040.1 XdhC family protein [Desulfoprunum benzoelyticum]
MRTILPSLCRYLALAQQVVIGTLVESSGSAPRCSGARMLLDRDGTQVGTIGGGEMEGTCLAKAGDMLEGGPDHALLHFAVTAGQGADAGMICGGTVQVLLQRLAPTHETVQFFQSLAADFAGRKNPILLTLFQPGCPPRFLTYVPGERSVIDLAPRLVETLARRAEAADRPFIVADGATKLHAEPLISPARLYLAGAGHVALATARLAHFLGLEVIVVDDRPEFASRARFPEACEVRVVAAYDQGLEGVQAGDHVVIATRSHAFDKEALAQSLGTAAGYIGMLGSRRKRDAIYAALRREGVSERDLGRVHCPIGLPIGGESPAEIALGIMAEIQQKKYGRAA